MGKKSGAKVTLDRDFAVADERALGAQIAAFAAEHEAAHGQILAMDGRRSLGPGKVRVTFRGGSARGGRGRPGTTGTAGERPSRARESPPAPRGPGAASRRFHGNNVVAERCAVAPQAVAVPPEAAPAPRRRALNSRADRTA